jgi:hypothetical protein
MERARKLETQALAWPVKAGNLIVRDQRSYDVAADLLGAIKVLRAEVNASYDPIIRKCHEAHRAAVAEKRRIEAPLAEAEDAIKRKVASFVRERERERLEEERRARDEAEREAECERADMLRAAREAGASRAELRAIKDAPVAVASVAVAPTFAKASNLVMRSCWVAEVTDMRVLCAAVADGTAPVDAVMPNGAVLNKLAAGLKLAMNIPGVRAVERDGVSVKGA